MIEFLTESKFKQILDNQDTYVWYSLIQKHLPPANITSLNKVSMFLAQTLHESAGYSRLEENLNYSSTALLRVFKKYFNQEIAKEYHRKPELIANRVYANRMGNGPELSGDGWKYRGKGLIQITGRNNHQLFADFLRISLKEALQYMTTKEGAVHSAVWYWNVNRLNAPSEAADIVRVTKIINGGTNGLPDREEQFTRILGILIH